MFEQANTVPVVLLLFNRPDCTEKLIDSLRPLQPKSLLVVADGPRASHTGDAGNCARVREIVRTKIDWDANVQTHFAEANLGLRKRVSSGLDWAFEKADRAIILEDDCIAHPTFFRFCGELLEKYEKDNRVGVISANNFQPKEFQWKYSYYFSHYMHCWGWASWRRSWKFFDEAMSLWPELKAQRWLNGMFENPWQAKFWEQIFDGVYERRIQSWAYAWMFACWTQNLLTVIPRVNLVSNIGFGGQATHTTQAASSLSGQPIFEMDFPLQHPPAIYPHLLADAHVQKNNFGAVKPKEFWPKLKYKIVRKLSER